MTALQEKRTRKDSKEEPDDEDLELTVFDLSTIFAATDIFSPGNKIGEGGFGPVYKVIHNYTIF